MVVYAIRIDNKYFKEYVYADKNTIGRYTGHSQLGNVIQEGDIIDLVLTDTPERTETKRSIAGSISTIYQVESMQNKIIEIIPIKN